MVGWFPQEEFQRPLILASSHTWESTKTINLWCLFFAISSNFFFFFYNFRATLSAYGSSQARGPIRATSAGLCHSHSNTRSEPHLWPTPQPQQSGIWATPATHTTAHGNAKSLTPWSNLKLMDTSQYFHSNHLTRCMLDCMCSLGKNLIEAGFSSVSLEQFPQSYLSQCPGL